jgi:hypothetical protein
MIGDAEYLKALSGYKQASAIKWWCKEDRLAVKVPAKTERGA